ncbi:MAG: GntR family transcriptional regulator [Gammaproteobacteria bacterium]
MHNEQSTWKENLPIYRQITDILIARIIDGVYAEDALLPSVRQIAEEFDVSNLTGAKVMQEMDLEGLTVKRRGVGSKVRPGARQDLLAQEQKKFQLHEWPELVARLNRLEIDVAALLKSLI